MTNNRWWWWLKMMLVMIDGWWWFWAGRTSIAVLPTRSAAIRTSCAALYAGQPNAPTCTIPLAIVHNLPKYHNSASITPLGRYPTPALSRVTLKLNILCGNSIFIPLRQTRFVFYCVTLSLCHTFKIVARPALPASIPHHYTSPLCYKTPIDKLYT